MPETNVAKGDRVLIRPDPQTLALKIAGLRGRVLLVPHGSAFAHVDLGGHSYPILQASLTIERPRQEFGDY